MENRNGAERRLHVIEIFEELYDEFEFLSGSFSELDDLAMSLFDLYDTGSTPETEVQEKWNELVEKHKEVEERSRAVAGLIQRCRARLGGMNGTGTPRESCLRLVEKNKQSQKSYLQEEKVHDTA